MAGKVMTKSQLVGLLAEKWVLRSRGYGMLETPAAAALSGQENGQFVIPGIGKLVKSTQARMGRNPQTGDRSRFLPRP